MKGWLAVAVFLANGGGCGRDGEDLAETSTRAALHVQAFADFDRWARRAVDGLPSTRASEAAYETVFAKLRRESSVLASWVEWREGSVPSVISLPKNAAPPESPAWVRLRGAHGGLEAALLTRCPAELAARRERPSARSCLLLKRTTLSRAHGPVAVTVLFHE